VLQCISINRKELNVKTCIAMLSALALCAMVAGCGKKPAESAPQPPVTAAKPAPFVTLNEAASVSVQPAPLVVPVQVQAAAEDLPLRLSSLLEQGGKARAGLVDKRTGNPFTAGEGETIAGFRLVTVDLDNERVVFTKNGREYVLTVTGDEAAARAALAALPAPSEPPQNLAAMSPVDDNTATPLYPQRADFSTMPEPPRFEPTPEERAKKIDPNDASTWPAEYQGPGIERALKEQGQQESE
jgi:hypothetical protein